jgi:hypothetical protein
MSNVVEESRPLEMESSSMTSWLPASISPVMSISHEQWTVMQQQPA